MTLDPWPIYLLDTSTGDLVEGELVHAIESAHMHDWHTKWQPALGDMKKQLTEQSVPKDQWPQSGHWDWPGKMADVAGLIGFRSCCVTVGGTAQGLMRLDLTKTARLDGHKGKPLVYVDYLEVAPWNQPVVGFPVQYKGIGTALMAAAIHASLDEGFKGRIGLDSLPQSVGFYQHLNMTEIGPGTHDPRLTYFEMTAEQAQAFIAQE